MNPWKRGYFGNASMSSADPYRTAWGQVRAGADAHLQHRSLGIGA